MPSRLTLDNVRCTENRGYCSVQRMEFMPGQNEAVTTEFSGTGDPRRTIELMWGAPGSPRRGPKPKITAEMIVQAAVAVADAEGLAALSMRRVADELDVAAMSLYTYVPGKAELL